MLLSATSEEIYTLLTIKTNMVMSAGQAKVYSAIKKQVHSICHRLERFVRDALCKVSPVLYLQVAADVVDSL